MRVHRFLALFLSALSLTMTSAHVLEMPQKLSYDLALYTAVNRTLYRYFAIVGGSYQILAIVAVCTLAWRARKSRTATWTLAAAIGITLAFVSWLLLVQPVNAAVAEGAGWSGLRLRWEVGHLVGFILSLLGFSALAIATVLQIDDVARPVHVEATRTIDAPADRLMALYLDVEHWPQLFPATIRGTHVVSRDGRVTTVDVDHATAGTVRNVVTVTGPHEITLDEDKPRYHARFVNRFDPVPGGCRYTVTADIALHGALRALRWLVRPIARRQIRRFVIEPMQARAASLSAPGRPS
ncbi:MAG TPA: SRPBCC family protein [Kofleriaceae bacterium]|nr:SRPBCC family protein [Kofleriaceae bacterium]